MKVTTAVFLSAALMAPIVGMAQGYDIGEAMKQAQQQRGTGGQSTQRELPKIVKLKNSDVTRYIKTVTQLKALGLTFDRKSAKRGPGRTMEAIEGNQKAMAILRKNKFTTDRLSQVAYSVGMAFASLDMDKDVVSKARSQSAQAMERIRGQMSAQQFEAMQKQMGASMKMADQMQNQPKGNVALVTKHRKALEATFKKKR